MLELVLIPVAVAVITQALKLIIDGIPNNFTWQSLLNNYGGMPSSHTAYVTALTTAVWLREGLDSTAFAISLVLMVVVIRDAIGFRQEIGKNALLTNTLSQQIFGNKAESLTEQIGHTRAEVFVGLIVGFLLTVILHNLFFV
jgi:acid phosphatase family membrane protein YuiD